MFNSKKDLVEKNEAISNDAFSLFNETVDKLSVANEIISIDIDIASANELKAKKEKESLQSIQSRNSSLSRKIQKLLRD